MKLAFLLSKGLLCSYDKQNNTWLLVDMEFLFSCSTRHLTSLLPLIVSYRVKHSKRNSISTCAHLLFFIYRAVQPVSEWIWVGESDDDGSSSIACTCGARILWIFELLWTSFHFFFSHSPVMFNKFFFLPAATRLGFFCFFVSSYFYQLKSPVEPLQGLTEG